MKKFLEKILFPLGASQLPRFVTIIAICGEFQLAKLDVEYLESLKVDDQKDV